MNRKPLGEYVQRTAQRRNHAPQFTALFRGIWSPSPPAGADGARHKETSIRACAHTRAHGDNPFHLPHPPPPIRGERRSPRNACTGISKCEICVSYLISQSFHPIPFGPENCGSFLALFLSRAFRVAAFRHCESLFSLSGSRVMTADTWAELLPQ